jgi:hypothetical protein
MRHVNVWLNDVRILGIIAVNKYIQVEPVLDAYRQKN